jgi:hypothetical protein
LYGFLPLPLKRGQIKRIRALYTSNWMIYFDLFLEARAQILKKIGSLGYLKTPKGYFEIN